MDKKFIREWLNHHLDPEHNPKPAMPDKGTPVSAVRRKCIDLICEKTKITVNDQDPYQSLCDAARKMNVAEMPSGDLDQQIAKLFQLAYSDLTGNGGSSPGGN